MTRLAVAGLCEAGRTGVTDPGYNMTHNKPKKADLPTKLCARCNRPFVWRKKWAKNWAEVKYCSERCRKG